jgi:hypothetical protein
MKLKTKSNSKWLLNLYQTSNKTCLVFCYIILYMNDKINQEFDRFQIELEKRKTNLKFVTKFEPSKDLDDSINELKKKEVVL